MGDELISPGNTRPLPRYRGQQPYENNQRHRELGDPDIRARRPWLMMFIVRREWRLMPGGQEPFVTVIVILIVVIVRLIGRLVAWRVPRVEMRGGQILFFGFRLELAQGPRFVCRGISLRRSRPVGVAGVARRLRGPGCRGAKTLHLANDIAEAPGAVPA